MRPFRRLIFLAASPNLNHRKAWTQPEMISRSAIAIAAASLALSSCAATDQARSPQNIESCRQEAVDHREVSAASERPEPAAATAQDLKRNADTMRSRALSFETCLDRAETIER